MRCALCSSIWTTLYIQVDGTLWGLTQGAGRRANRPHAGPERDRDHPDPGRLVMHNHQTARYQGRSTGAPVGHDRRPRSPTWRRRGRVVGPGWRVSDKTPESDLQECPEHREQDPEKEQAHAPRL